MIHILSFFIICCLVGSDLAHSSCNILQPKRGRALQTKRRHDPQTNVDPISSGTLDSLNTDQYSLRELVNGVLAEIQRNRPEWALQATRFLKANPDTTDTLKAEVGLITGERLHDEWRKLAPVNKEGEPWRWKAGFTSVNEFNELKRLAPAHLQKNFKRVSLTDASSKYGISSVDISKFKLKGNTILIHNIAAMKIGRLNLAWQKENIEAGKVVAEHVIERIQIGRPIDIDFVYSVCASYVHPAWSFRNEIREPHLAKDFRDLERIERITYSVRNRLFLDQPDLLFLRHLLMDRMRWESENRDYDDAILQEFASFRDFVNSLTWLENGRPYLPSFAVKWLNAMADLAKKDAQQVLIAIEIAQESLLRYIDREYSSANLSFR